MIKNDDKEIDCKIQNKEEIIKNILTEKINIKVLHINLGNNKIYDLDISIEYHFLKLLIY